MKKSILTRIFTLLLTLLVMVGAVGCTSDEISNVLDIVDAVVNQNTADTVSDAEPELIISELGHYTEKDDVALYIHTYSHLPENFITKAEAKKLGWNGGSLEEYAKGCAIGGDIFKNLEGLLPEKDGRIYTECDIGTVGQSSRGAKRIVFSNDGLIYYTDNHYESFTLLYGD